MSTVSVSAIPIVSLPSPVVALASAVDPQQFASLLPKHWQEMSMKRRAAWLSMWSQWFFAKTLTPWIERFLAHQQAQPLWLMQGQLALNNDGFPCDLACQHPMLTVSDHTTTHQVLMRLIDLFIEPVCQCLAFHCNNQYQLFWSNAAIRIYQGVKRANCPLQAKNSVMTWLTTPTRENGQRNFLCLKPSNDTTLCRKDCCLRSRLDYPECRHCPLTTKLTKPSRNDS